MKQNEQQQEAIRHRDGPMMVLAGPGAGKTYVITNRVKYLIEACQIEPEKILVVTFSKAAAAEMKERFCRIMGKGHYPVRFGTFHSLFFQILRTAYHYEAKDIVTPALKYRFLEEALREADFEVEDRKEFLEDIEKEISRVKGEGIDVSCYYSANCPEQVFRDIFWGYQGCLKRHRALDFDDMVGYAWQLLKDRPDILSHYQKQFSYILIDEFQDINRLQYETIRLLAKPEDNIFIVGDDDQSIYGFRGARPDIMLSFPAEFPRAKRVELGMNYRCSAQILTAADRLIRHNRKRFDKHLTAISGRIASVHISRYRDLTAEAEKIMNRLQKYEREGTAAEKMAVLFRTNRQMRLLAGKLMEYNIPFSMKENLPNIFDTWMAKDLLCYVELAMGDKKREKFLKICNRPVRYISRAAFERQEVSFEELREYYRKKNQAWMQERIRDFENELRTIRTLPPYSALHYIRRGIGYDEYVKQYAKEKNVAVGDLMDTLAEIHETARECASLSQWLAYADSYGEKLAEIQKENARSREGVSLMTMHGAKGLEFDAVFIPTMNEGICPYRKAIQAGDLEEERRMLYVAMTRARKYLHLSFVKERFHKPAEPSRFLSEISPELKKKTGK